MRKLLRIALIVVSLLLSAVVAGALLLPIFVTVGARQISDSGMIELDAANERLTYRSMHWTAPRNPTTLEIMATLPDWQEGWNFYSFIRTSDWIWPVESTGAFGVRTDNTGVADGELTGRSYSVSIWPLLAFDSLIPIIVVIWATIPLLKRVKRARPRPLPWPDQFPRCQKCGYDLRGTPRRCPECGTIPKRPNPPVSPDGIGEATKNLTAATDVKRRAGRP